MLDILDFHGLVEGQNKKTQFVVFIFIAFVVAALEQYSSTE